jgi:hypothetical protein
MRLKLRPDVIHEVAGGSASASSTTIGAPSAANVIVPAGAQRLQTQFLLCPRPNARQTEKQPPQSALKRCRLAVNDPRNALLVVTRVDACIHPFILFEQLSFFSFILIVEKGDMENAAI